MKKWYQWFYLSIAFAIGGMINYLTHRQITAAILQVTITVALGFIQHFCDRHGEKGKKIYTYILTGSIILLTIGIIYLVLNAI